MDDEQCTVDGGSDDGVTAMLLVRVEVVMVWDTLDELVAVFRGRCFDFGSILYPLSCSVESLTCLGQAVWSFSPVLYVSSFDGQHRTVRCRQLQSLAQML